MKLKLLTAVVISVLGSTYMPCVQAQGPAGFEELTRAERIKIKVAVNDDNYTELYALMSYDKVTLEKEAAGELRQFLNRQYIKPSAVNNIVSQLLMGVKSSTDCLGRRTSCQLREEAMATTHYVVVKSKKLLRILLPEESMSTKVTKDRYIEDEVDENAVLMHHRLNVNDGTDMESSLFYNNQIVAGAFGGYFKSNSILATEEYKNRDSKFSFDELSYNRAFGSHKLRVGYTADTINRSWNSTSILDTHERTGMFAIEFGSSQQLEFKNKSTAARLYFSIPTSGRLIVTRPDGSPVLEKNVTAGQNFISYSELPRGFNTLQIVVMSGEREVYRDVRRINNTDGYELQTGEYDFKLSLGQLTKQTYDYDHIDNNQADDYQHNAFINAKVATQVTQNFSIATEVFNTQSDYYFKGAFAYILDENLTLDALYGVFDDKSTYARASLWLYGINIEWNKFKDEAFNATDTSLGNYFYGFGSYDELTATYNHRLGDGNLYANYSYFESQGGWSIDEFEDERYNQYQSITAGYSFRSFWDSTIDVNSTYRYSKDLDQTSDDRVEFGLSVSIPFGMNANATFNTLISEDYQSHRAAVNNSYTINNELSLMAEAGMTVNESTNMPSDSLYDTSVSASYINEHLSSSAYAYASSDSAYSVYGDISSSTILVDDSFYSSAKKSDSYLIIDNKNKEDTSLETSSDFMSVANIKGNGDSKGRITVDEDVIIHAIDSYQEYQVTLDEGASDYRNSGDSMAKGSSYPGSVVTMDVEMREVQSYISVFNDIEGQPVNDVTCSGRGCLKIEELTVGIFKFTIRKGLPFQLQSNNERCLIPDMNDLGRQNLGENFCMPSFELQSGMQISQGANGKYYYYIGEFNDEHMIKRYQEALKNEPLTFIQKSVGERQFLFIETDNLMVRRNMDALDELISYALEERKEAPYVSR